MTAYLCIFAAAVLFSAQFIIAKQYESRSNGTLKANVWMLLFMGVWAFLVFFSLNGFKLTASPTAWLICFAYSACCFLCNLFSQAAFSRGKVGLVSLFSQVGGQMLPFLYGVLFTHDTPSWLCWVGFALMLVSFVPTILGMRKSSDRDEKTDPVFILLCLAGMTLNGLVAIITDINAKAPEGASSNDFLAMFGILTVAMSALFLAVTAIREKGVRSLTAICRDPSKGMKGFFVMSLVMLVYMLVNGFANVFSLAAASSDGMTASVQFPILSALTIILAPLWARIIFREKITKRDALSLALAAIGVLLYLADAFI